MTEEKTGGTAAMRAMLRSRARRWDLTIIARDINDRLARDATRAAALAMARKIAGADADDGSVAALAKSLTVNLADSIARETSSIGSAELQNFIDEKKDLPLKFKTALAQELYGDHIAFDAVADRLVDTRPPAPPSRVVTPPQWKHPNEAIARAQAAYHAALKAAQPPRPIPKPRPGLENAGRFPKRQGFA